MFTVAEARDMFRTAVKDADTEALQELRQEMYTALEGSISGYKACAFKDLLLEIKQRVQPLPLRSLNMEICETCEKARDEWRKARDEWRKARDEWRKAGDEWRKAGDEHDKAWEECDKTWEECDKTWEEYDKAWDEHPNH